MNKNTIEEYIKGVKAKYDEAKTAEFSGFLLNPSPAELKNLCLVLVDKGINKLDQEILDMFFDINDKSGKRKQIEHFEVDKLKPISNFLKGKTAATRIVNLDVIAVLVDFNPRPYRKFIAGDKEELTAFWSDSLQIDRSQFRYYIKKSNQSDMSYKTGFGYGTCSIYYGNRDLYEKIMQSLRYFKNYYL